MAARWRSAIRSAPRAASSPSKRYTSCSARRNATRSSPCASVAGRASPRSSSASEKTKDRSRARLGQLPRLGAHRRDSRTGGARREARPHLRHVDRRAGRRGVRVDGGLVNPVRVSMCRAFGAEIVIAVALSWGKLGPYRNMGRELPVPPAEEPGWFGRVLGAKRSTSTEPPIPSIFEVFNTALDIVEQRVARSRLAGDPADVLITPLLPNFGSMEYHRAKEAIAEGHAPLERLTPLLPQIIG